MINFFINNRAPTVELISPNGGEILSGSYNIYLSRYGVHYDLPTDEKTIMKENTVISFYNFIRRIFQMFKLANIE
jgi:hypothetical protein